MSQLNFSRGSFTTTTAASFRRLTLRCDGANAFDESRHFVGRGVASATRADQSVGAQAKPLDHGHRVKVAAGDKHGAFRQLAGDFLDETPRTVNATVGVRAAVGGGP